MPRLIKKEKPANKTPQKKSPKHLTAKQIVRRHMKNDNDVITEDDLKNVKIETCIPGEIKNDLPATTDKGRSKDEGKDHPVITSWDVIKE